MKKVMFFMSVMMLFIAFTSCNNKTTEYTEDDTVFVEDTACIDSMYDTICE